MSPFGPFFLGGGGWGHMGHLGEGEKCVDNWKGDMH